MYKKIYVRFLENYNRNLSMERNIGICRSAAILRRFLKSILYTITIVLNNAFGGTKMCIYKNEESWL